jgi:hypothetical protein
MPTGRQSFSACDRDEFWNWRGEELFPLTRWVKGNAGYGASDSLSSRPRCVHVR